MRTYFRLTSFVLALLAATQVAGQTLEARKPFRKPSERHLTATENATGEIVVKFHDHVRARVSPSGQLNFLGQGNLGEARRLLRNSSLQPAIKVSPIELDALEAEAAANSGKAQPDLGGLISVRVADVNDKMGIEKLARRLNRLDSVEFATIKHSLKVSSALPTGYNGYCRLPVEPLLCVQVTTQAECDQLGGSYSLSPCTSQGVSPVLGPCCLDAAVAYPPNQDPNVQIQAVCVDATFEDCQAAGGLYGNGEFRGPFEWTDADGDGIAQPSEILPASNDFLAISCTDSGRGACALENQLVYDDNLARGGGINPLDPGNYPIGNAGGAIFNDPNAWHGGFDSLASPFPGDVDDDSVNALSYGACCIGNGTMFDGACVDLTLFDCFRAGGIWRGQEAAATQTSAVSPDDAGSCVTLDDDLDIQDEYEGELDEPCELLDSTSPLNGNSLGNAFQTYWSCFFNENGFEPWATVNLSPSRVSDLLPGPNVLGGPYSPSCANFDCCNAVIEISPDCANQWDEVCVQLAKSIRDCANTQLNAATALYGGNVYMPYRDEPTSNDYRTPVDVELVDLVVRLDPECNVRWDMTCAEYARLFSHRLNLVGDANSSRRRTPDLTALQHNLSAEQFDFEQTPVQQALDGLSSLQGSSVNAEPFEVAKARFIRSLPRAEINTQRAVVAYSGQGLGVRGLPGEPHIDGLDLDGDGVYEPKEDDTRSPGYWQLGERFSDFGLDGIPGQFVQGAIYPFPNSPVELTCIPVPLNLIAIAEQVYGDSFHDDPLTPEIEWVPDPVNNPGVIDVVNIGDPFPCEIISLAVNICGENIPLYNDPSRGRDFASTDEGECDGLYTNGTGGAEYAISWARNKDLNGGVEPIYDRSGLMSLDGRYGDGELVDRGDELFRGRGARIGVIDFAYHKGHEDLDQPGYQWKRFEMAPGVRSDANYEPRKPYVILEEGQTLLRFPEVGYPDHGTAVLGQLCALDEARDWVDASGNAFVNGDGEPEGVGITGIVPEAQPYFFPLISVEEGPRELTAWSNAIRAFGPGDILCAPYEPAGISTTLVASPDIVLLSQVAFDKGILVVVAAGNGKQDIDLEAADAGVDIESELGMCIVASSSFLDTGRGISTFANPAVDDGDIPNGFRARGSNFGTIVDLHFWDEYNVSCGYGDLYTSLVQDENQDQSADGYDIDRKRSYTGHFGGTSAAATNIAGAACALNGLARQLYGVPATPVGMRDSALKPYTVETPYNSATNPVGFEYNTLDTTPNRRLVYPIDLCPPDVCETLITIGWRPRIWEFGRDDSAVVQVATNLSGSIFEDDAPDLLGYYVIQGESNGNLFSLKGDDGGRLVISSEFALGSEGGSPGGNLNGSFGGESRPSSFNKVVERATRPVSGVVTDLLALAECPVDPSIITSITAEVQVLPPAAQFMLFGFSLWDNQSQRWRLVDIQLLPEEPGDPDLTLNFEALAGFGLSDRYVDPQSRTWARVWTWTLDSLLGGTNEALDISYDLLNIEFNYGPDSGGP